MLFLISFSNWLALHRIISSNTRTFSSNIFHVQVTKYSSNELQFKCFPFFFGISLFFTIRKIVDRSGATLRPYLEVCQYKGCKRPMRSSRGVPSQMTAIQNDSAQWTFLTTLIRTWLFESAQVPSSACALLRALLKVQYTGCAEICARFTVGIDFACNNACFYFTRISIKPLQWIFVGTTLRQLLFSVCFNFSICNYAVRLLSN